MYIYTCTRTRSRTHTRLRTRPHTRFLLQTHTTSAIAVTMVGGTHILQSKFESFSALAAIRVHGITTLVVVPAMLGIQTYITRTYTLYTYVTFLMYVRTSTQCHSRRHSSSRRSCHIMYDSFHLEPHGSEILIFCDFLSKS